MGFVPAVALGTSAKSISKGLLRQLFFICPTVLFYMGLILTFLVTWPFYLCAKVCTCCVCCSFTIGSAEEDGESGEVNLSKQTGMAATMSIYPYHVETYARNTTRFLCCLVRGGPIHSIMTHLFGWGSDRYFSPIVNLSVVQSSVPGARASILLLSASMLLSLVFVTSGKKVGLYAGAVVLVIGALVSLYWFCLRRATVYIGDESRNSGWTSLTGREGHFVEFTAMDADAEAIVGEVMQRHAAVVEQLKQVQAMTAHAMPPAPYAGQVMPTAPVGHAVQPMSYAVGDKHV